MDTMMMEVEKDDDDAIFLMTLNPWQKNQKMIAIILC